MQMHISYQFFLFFSLILRILLFNERIESSVFENLILSNNFLFINSLKIRGAIVAITYSRSRVLCRNEL